MSRATSFKGLLGNLRFIAAWKTWAVLVVFGAGIAVGLALCHATVDGSASRRTGLDLPLDPTAHSAPGHVEVVAGL